MVGFAAFSNALQNQCTICNEKFNSQELLDNHIQSCFQLNQQVTCNKCYQSFPQFLQEDHKAICQGESILFDPQTNRFLLKHEENNQQIHNDNESRLKQDSNLYIEDEEQEENIEEDEYQQEEEEDRYYEESKQNQINFTDDQINSILDTGGQLPQFEDHDLSNTGGLNNQQIEIFPTCKYDPKKNQKLSRDQIMCSICLDEFEKFQWLKTLGCLHRFHKKCINHWLIKNKLCPICKVDQKQFV